MTVNERNGAPAASPAASSAPPVAGADAPDPTDGAGGRAPRRGSLGLGLLLVIAGTLWLLAQAGVAIPWELLLPVALVVVGALLLLGGRWGAHGGLIALGIVLAVIALFGSVAPTPSVSAGDRTHVVTAPGELESSYSLGAGTLTMDLRELELPAGTTEVAASVSMGEVVVRVPPEVAVHGDASAGMGEVAGFGRESSGIAPRLSLSAAGVDADTVLDLDLRAGLGSVEVTR